MIGVMEFAWSDEGFQFILSSSQLFQDDAASLYRGHDPVPER